MCFSISIYGKFYVKEKKVFMLHVRLTLHLFTFSITAHVHVNACLQQSDGNNSTLALASTSTISLVDTLAKSETEIIYAAERMLNEILMNSLVDSSRVQRI